MSDYQITLIQRAAHRDKRFGICALCYWALRGDDSARESLLGLVRR